MTKKLYNSDSRLCEFEATVTETDGDRVVLDRTAFFPEGGGQTSDIGFLDSLKVTDVQEENGVIYHKVCGELTLKPGDKVKGRIDFKKRFSDMQQHSGEHIVSGIIHNTFGLENIGFHLTENEVALDFGKVFTREEIDFIEEKANEAVTANLKINVLFPTEEELKRIPYRSKKELTGEIRIVEIEGVDVCACCAPHVERTGEIGIIKIVGFEKHRNGTRIYILCGKRALLDYRKKQDENHAVSVLLKAKEYETSEAVEQLLKRKSESDSEIIRLNFLMADAEAEKIPAGEKILVFSSLTGSPLTRFADKIKDKASDFAAVFGQTGENEYRFVIGSNSTDVREIGKKMNTALSSRGGGKPQMIQGSVSATEKEIRDFFSSLDM